MFGPSPLPRTLAAAQRDVSHKDVSVRQSVLRDLGVLAQGDQRDSALALLRQVVTGDPSAMLRGSAAMLLSDLEATEEVVCLFQAMTDPVLLVRQNALLALGELLKPDMDSVKELWSMLPKSLTAPEPELRFQALIAAARTGFAGTPLALLRALKDADPKLRILALRLVDEHFSDAQRSEHRAELGALLKDPVMGVRVAAALLLAPGGDSSARQIVVQAINEPALPEEPADVQALIELAGDLGLVAAKPGLRRLLRGRFGLGAGRFEFQARRALAQMEDSSVLGELERGLRSFSAERRRLTVVLIGQARRVEFEAELRRLGAAGRIDPATLEAALKQLHGG